MAEITPKDPGRHDKTPRSYATEPPRPIDVMDMPVGVSVRPSLNYIEPKHNTFIVSVATMVFTSLITFYIPLFNGLLGGVFGGFHARRWGRALGAALVNSLVVPAILLFAYGFDTPDLQRLFYGLGVQGWLALHVIGTFIGAVAGVASRPLALTGRLRRAHVGPGDTRTVPVTTPVSRSVTRERVEARANPTTTTVRR